ncbi:hypothetical protein SEA_SHROOMS_31 [Arthrobacter phage Shrooms]|nr:hypothetical protein SEA_SHROOMS_31 [Arthrobacter phage Shrooms]
MTTNLEPLDPLDTLMVAIDTSIGALVTARALLEQTIIQQEAMEAQRRPATPKPILTMGGSDGTCQHDGDDLRQLPTMGDEPQFLCPCGEIVTEVPGG